MIKAVLRAFCGILIIVGLLWVYTLMYGGPFGPFFVWVTHDFPGALKYLPNPVPIRPITG